METKTVEQKKMDALFLLLHGQYTCVRMETLEYPKGNDNRFYFKNSTVQLSVQANQICLEYLGLDKNDIIQLQLGGDITTALKVLRFILDAAHSQKKQIENLFL